jgi:glycosyltransferase involved in cell wall biosynthesis
VGQLGLAMPSFFNWLSKRPDIISIMMLHDAIPIKHPQLVSPKATNYHKQMIKTAAKRAHYLIFNSNCTHKNVTEVMLELGLSCPPSLVRSLPLPAAYLGDVATLTNLSGTRYFVAVSTVEPRKNYTLLLRIWERFIVTMGAAAPHLVIVGSPGKGAEQILAPLKLDADLGGRVHHVIGLSSPSLAALVLGATGMLCPSFAEGFGLPVLEASAMGVATIASDIPAHREVGATGTIFLAPDDEDAWMAAITATPSVTKRSRPDIPYALTEDAYSADIMKFISGMRTGATTLAPLI